MNELEPLFEKLTSVAASVGTTVVAAFVRAEDDPSPTEFLIGADAALNLIEVTKPPILYISSQVLDLADLISSAIEEMSDDDDAETTKAIRAAAKLLKRYDGKIGRVIVHFFVGFAMHTMIIAADWLETFESDLEIIEEQKEARTELILSATEKDDRVHLERLANELVAEPAFNYSRTSFAKRLLLAEQMFPKEDRSVLDKAVSIAENLDWLKKSGFQQS